VGIHFCEGQKQATLICDDGQQKGALLSGGGGAARELLGCWFYAVPA